MGRWRPEHIYYGMRFIAWCKGWEKNREGVDFRDWSISVISLYRNLYFIYVQELLFITPPASTQEPTMFSWRKVPLWKRILILQINLWFKYSFTFSPIKITLNLAGTAMRCLCSGRTSSTFKRCYIKKQEMKMFIDYSRIPELAIWKCGFQWFLSQVLFVEKPVFLYNCGYWYQNISFKKFFCTIPVA